MDSVIAFGIQQNDHWRSNYPIDENSITYLYLRLQQPISDFKRAKEGNEQHVHWGARDFFWAVIIIQEWGTIMKKKLL